ncbi:hypothetical protein H2198_002859 [Neophaeococcomyces mojaviensis]|uniref:Uncharacterized protein n=1 Tax=Neophaeococcomyces mojaviensis TaxID=3383035 RepID=A0ACC3ADA9_9EURO|nr:hypothetical protein H2198_002859 [Knufia sp. JES_112]
MNSTPTRRSKRQRIASKQHSDTVGWTEETLQMLRASSESSDRSSTSLESEPVYERRDVEFQNAAVADADEDMEEEVIHDSERLSDASALEDDANDPDLITTVTRGSSTVATSTKKTKSVLRSRVQLTKAWAAEKGLRNRMVPEGREYLKGTNDKTYAQNYGPDLDDLYPILQSRDVWHIFSRDVTLPSRASLASALKLIPKGYLKPKSPSSAQPENGAKQTANSEPASRQVVSLLSREEAYAKKYLEIGSSHDIVLGPWDSAKKFKIGYLQAFDVSQAWTKTLSLSESHPTSDAGHNSWHQGWLFNIGARPQHLAWAPTDSDHQYLAVTSKSSQTQRDTAPPVSSKLAPAFCPSPAYPSHIQIWRIKALLSNAETPALIDYDTSPQLSQVLCTKWGNILRIEWSPLPENVPLPIPSRRNLAILSSDGCVRVVHVDLQESAKTIYLEYQQPQSVAQPPSHTIHTTFCFASPYDLVIGGADGAVRIYNCKTIDSTGILQPYLTIQAHSTYVMSVSVPMETPHFLCSSSASGEMTLTDLRSPVIDRLPIHKARLPTRNLSYLPFTRMFITTNDASGNSQPDGTTLSTVVCHSLRHFYFTKAIMKLPEASGITTCLVTSQFHPCILVANAQGSVWASNHLRRCLPMAHGPAKDVTGGGWMQKIFEYDWQPLPVPPPATQSLSQPRSSTSPSNEHPPTHQFVSSPVISSESKTMIDIYYGSSTRPGSSRIHEGFRPERIELSVQSKKTSKPNPEDVIPGSGKSTASSQVIFHEEQAVSAMAWNPNPRFASWAAVSWGSGVMRVGDLGHDAI